MGDEVVPFGDDASQTATLLLAAAEDLGLDQRVVGTVEGGFLVPTMVKEHAFPDESAEHSEPEPEPEKKAPAKKAPAKKAAKKTAAKKKE